MARSLRKVFRKRARAQKSQLSWQEALINLQTMMSANPEAFSDEKSSVLVTALIELQEEHRRAVSEIDCLKETIVGLKSENEKKDAQLYHTSLDLEKAQLHLSGLTYCELPQDQANLTAEDRNQADSDPAESVTEDGPPFRLDTRVEITREPIERIARAVIEPDGDGVIEFEHAWNADAREARAHHYVVEGAALSHSISNGRVSPPFDLKRSPTTPYHPLRRHSTDPPNHALFPPPSKFLTMPLLQNSTLGKLRVRRSSSPNSVKDIDGFENVTIEI